MDEISAVGLEMDLVLRKLLWNVLLLVREFSRPCPAISGISCGGWARLNDLLSSGQASGNRLMDLFIGEA